MKAVSLDKLKLKIYADGADLDRIKLFYDNPLIKGFTTNPTLMKKNGINNYEDFAKNILNIVKDKPISFEVFADELILLLNKQNIYLHGVQMFM